MSFLSKTSEAGLPAGRRGFTLTELIVSMAIALAILTTVMLNQSVYVDAAALRNAADNISLSLLEAQIYGVGVREFSAGGADFDLAYGVEFNIIPSTGSNNAYIFFGDRGAKNGVYDSGWACPIGGASECSEKETLGNGNIIRQLCQIPISGTESCNVGRTDITFLRPNTAANIVYFDTSGNIINFSNPSGVRIRLESPRGQTRSVKVYKTGQISVE